MDFAVSDNCAIKHVFSSLNATLVNLEAEASVGSEFISMAKVSVIIVLVAKGFLSDNAVKKLLLFALPQKNEKLMIEFAMSVFCGGRHVGDLAQSLHVLIAESCFHDSNQFFVL